MSDWYETRLGDIADICIGGTPSRAETSYWASTGEEGFPWVSISDLKSRIVSNTAESITALGARNSNVKLVPCGTIMMSFKLSLGRIAFAGRDIYTNEAIASFEVGTDKIDKTFLFYQLPEVVKLAITDTAIKGATLNKAKLNELVIPHPELVVQRKIAEILSTIDNQIDATQALIDKYTAIKQGMMADLFSRGIDPATKALRPAFEEAPELYHETPLGMLPKGWDVVELQTVATVERGKFTHRPRDDKRCFSGGYPFIQTGDVAACVGNHLTQYKQTLSDFGRSVSKEFPVGTVAVTIAANIADTAILAMPMCFPDSVVGVVVDERLSSSRFVELCIRMSKAKLDALAPQSAQKNINLEDLRPLKLPFPSRVEQELVCSSYEAINDPINSLINEKKKLIAQKSGLMQDLLTGKVPVPA